MQGQGVMLRRGAEGSAGAGGGRQGVCSRGPCRRDHNAGAEVVALMNFHCSNSQGREEASYICSCNEGSCDSFFLYITNTVQAVLPWALAYRLPANSVAIA